MSSLMELRLMIAGAAIGAIVGSLALFMTGDPRSTPNGPTDMPAKVRPTPAKASQVLVTVAPASTSRPSTSPQQLADPTRPVPATQAPALTVVPVRSSDPTAVASPRPASPSPAQAAAPTPSPAQSPGSPAQPSPNPTPTGVIPALPSLPAPTLSVPQLP
jgi:hypothetical protein